MSPPDAGRRRLRLALRVLIPVAAALGGLYYVKWVNMYSWADAIAFMVWRDEGTERAPGFRQEEFRKIRIGDSMQLVRIRLGEPLEIQDNVEWRYTRRHDPAANYHIRSVRFDSDGRVDRIVSEFWVD